MKLKINFEFDPKGSSLLEVFNLSEGQAQRVEEDINVMAEHGISAVDLMKKCVDKYKNTDLLIAICFIWMLGIANVQFQAMLDEHMQMASLGVRMPKEIQ